MSEQIKPWQDRVRESYSETVDGPTLSPLNAACAEIAELRAALAQQGAAQATHAGAATELPKLSWLDAPSDIANEHAHAWAMGWNAARLAAIAASAKGEAPCGR